MSLSFETKCVNYAATRINSKIGYPDIFVYMRGRIYYFFVFFCRILIVLPMSQKYNLHFVLFISQLSVLHNYCYQIFIIIKYWSNFLLFQKTLDANRYATKKTIAQGMLDIALLTANASQLKYILQVGHKHEFYTLMLSLIIISIVLQVRIYLFSQIII